MGQSDAPGSGSMRSRAEADPGGGGVRMRLLERDLTKEAEGEGFEPSSDGTARNGFRDRRIRPLCHPSEAETEGFEPSMQVFTHITP